MPRIHLPVSTDRTPISSKTGSASRLRADWGPVCRYRQVDARHEGRTAVDHHAAAAADAGAANEVELQGRILLLANLAQGDEQGHVFRFVDLVSLHARHALLILRVEAKNADL